MKPWMLERLLWTITAGAVAMTAGQVVLGSRPTSLSGSPLPSMTGVLMYDPAQLRDAADSVSSSNPFRLDRHPSTPTPDAPTVAVPPAAPTLALELSGVIGGPPWRAIVSGIPGRDAGVVVRAGDTLGGMRIRSIRRDTVVIQAGDSTMTLILKK
jgi:hypothetical protein